MGSICIVGSSIDVLWAFLVDKGEGIVEFRFIDSSPTWYGIAKQLEYHLTQLGVGVSETEGVTLCYANDIGSYLLDTATPMTPDNHWPLQRAVESHADILLCSQIACMKWFQRPHTYYIPSAANTELFHPYADVVRDIPIGFCGFIRHPPRVNFISTLSAAFPTTFHPYFDGLFFENLARYYSTCQIVVNDGQWTEVAMRVFEATACGACLVTKRVPGIEDLFEEDVEVVFYDEQSEMIEKVRELLAHPVRRVRIARAGMERVRRDHTYAHRAAVVKAVMTFFLGRRYLTAESMKMSNSEGNRG